MSFGFVQLRDFKCHSVFVQLRDLNVIRFCSFRDLNVVRFCFNSEI